MMSQPPDGPPVGESESAEARDPLRAAIHAMLIVYLSPAFLVVFAIGGASILLDGASRRLGFPRRTPGGRPVMPPKFLGRPRGRDVAGLPPNPGESRGGR